MPQCLGLLLSNARRELLCDRKRPFAHLAPGSLVYAAFKAGTTAGAPLVNKMVLDATQDELVRARSRLLLVLHGKYIVSIFTYLYMITEEPRSRLMMGLGLPFFWLRLANELSHLSSLFVLAGVDSFYGSGRRRVT